MFFLKADYLLNIAFIPYKIVITFLLLKLNDNFNYKESLPNIL